jgi:hypothetical protein
MRWSAAFFLRSTLLLSRRQYIIDTAPTMQIPRMAKEDGSGTGFGPGIAMNA